MHSGSINKSSSDVSTSSSDDNTKQLFTHPSGQINNDARKFEQVLDIIGGNGLWNWTVFLLTSMSGFFSALHNLGYAFLAGKSNYWCQLPQLQGNINVSYELLLNYSVPWIIKDGEPHISDSCHHYDRPWSNLTLEIIDDELSNNRTPSLISCNQWTFDMSVHKSTVNSEWGLVCDETWLASTVQAMYMVGIMVGSPVFGVIADKFGRRRGALIASVIYVISGLSSGVAGSYWLFLILRFLLGFASPGVYASGYVLAIEVFEPSKRALVGNFFCLPFALGYMVLPLLSYFIREWRWLQFAMAMPSLLLILYWFFLPESPRWLLRQGRCKEAEVILRRAMKKNKRELKTSDQEFMELLHEVSRSEQQLVSGSSSSEIESNSCDNPSRAMTSMNKTSIGTSIKKILQLFSKLLRTPNMRRRVLIIYYIWVVNGMVYYGIALNAPNLTANVFLYIFISGLLEIPSYLLPVPLVEWAGRRKIFSGFLFLAGVSLLCILLVPTDVDSAILTLAMVGKFSIGASYSLIYLYATELLPTEIRSNGLGTASMVGRVGSIVAPYIVDILGAYDQAYPSTIFGVCALLAGFLALFLPETKDKPLPDTVQDVEGKRKSLRTPELDNNGIRKRLSSGATYKATEPTSNGI